MTAPFFIKPFVDTGLGNFAYLIGSHDTKKGILIDPLRDVDRYLHAASELGLTLTHVLDTHLHADFVSGNREIAHQTGAVIGASAEAKVGFDHNPLTETSIIDLGAFQIHVMTTPGHIPNSYGIRVDAPLVTWAGWTILFGSRILLLAEDAAQRSEATRQLIRIGYDDLVGYIEGGIEAWAREYPVETIQSMSAKELRERLGEVYWVDVRMRSEWDAGHIPTAVHFEGGRIAWEELPFPLDQSLAIQCASGNRSMTAISVLKRRGYHNVIQVEGGINRWRMHKFEVVRDNPG